MYSKPFIRLVLLSCVALAVSCGDSEFDGSKDGPPDTEPIANTEVSLIIADPDSNPDELAFSIDRVSYRIVCPDSGLTPVDDSVDIAGEFGVVEDTDPPIWQMATDLPPSFCTISMWVFHEDEVVCNGSEGLPIVDDGDPTTTNQFSLVLICSLSTNTDSGDLELEGTFEEVIGNSCPRLIWMNAVPTTFGPGSLPIASVEVYAIDPDGTCGNNCDPQTCDFSSSFPVCTPGPDPGLVTTFTTTSGEGTFGDPNASDTTYTCDPAFPGPTEVCVSASDGDVECVRTRCIDILCP